LRERVLAVLGCAGAPLSADDVLAQVNADGGRLVRIGTVRNALGQLVEAGQVVRQGRGLYALSE